MSDENDGAEPNKSTQRAQRKPRAKGQPPKRDRVQVFRKLMADGKFITGITVVEYARKWGIAEQTARLDSAEASRSFEETDEERAAFKARWLAQIESATANARKLKRCESEVRFLELQGKARGFLDQKIELNAKVATVELEDLDQLRRAAEANEWSTDAESASGKSKTGLNS